MRVILIHNPTAGDASHSPKKLTRLVATAGEVIYRSAKDKDWQSVFEEPADLIVAAGGDGTVRRVALHAPHGSRIAVLPLGTANNVANSLGIGGTPKEVVAAWTTACVQPLDLGCAVGPWGNRRFLEGVGIGAITLTAARMEAGDAEGKEKDSGIVRARKTLNAVLGNGLAHWFDVTVDGQSICEKAALLEIANMSYIGPRLALAPMADPGDGRLDIVWIAEEDRPLMREWLQTASAEDTDAPVKTCRGSRIQIHHARGQIRLDDTYWPPKPNPDHDAAASDIDITVDKAALSVLVPA